MKLLIAPFHVPPDEVLGPLVSCVRVYFLVSLLCASAWLFWCLYMALRAKKDLDQPTFKILKAIVVCQVLLWPLTPLIYRGGVWTELRERLK